MDVGVSVKLALPTGQRGPAPRAATGGSWSIELVAGNDSGSTSSATLGVSSLLTDRLAVAAPPSTSTPEVRIGLVDAAGRALAADLEPAGAMARSWNLTATAAHDGAVELSWPKLGRTLPSGLVVELTDLSSGQSVLLNSRGAYRYVAKAGEGRAVTPTTRTGHAARAEVLSLGAVPNRGRGLSVTLTLSAPAQATLTVRGLGGHVVRRVDLGAVSAGATAA